MLIHPVLISSGANQCVYVVVVPQGQTAHQASDHRYYKRFNFASVPMEDHEIRDVMGRLQYPHVELDFCVESTTLTVLKKTRLLIIAKNLGRVYAQFVNCVVYLPPALTSHTISLFNRDLTTIDGKSYFILRKENTRRDVIEEDEQGKEKLGSSWFDPLLPSLSHQWRWELPHSFLPKNVDDEQEIYWEVYADSAPVRKGNIKVKDLVFTQRRETLRRTIEADTGRVRLILIVIGLVFTLILIVMSLGALPASIRTLWALLQSNP